LERLGEERQEMAGALSLSQLAPNMLRKIRGRGAQLINLNQNGTQDETLSLMLLAPWEA